MVSLPKPMLLVSQAVQVGHVMNVDIADTEHSGWIPSTIIPSPNGWICQPQRLVPRTAQELPGQWFGSPLELPVLIQKMIPEDPRSEKCCHDSKWSMYSTEMYSTEVKNRVCSLCSHYFIIFIPDSSFLHLGSQVLSWWCPCSTPRENA